MKTPRIDLIGQNGGDGAHYKYEEVAESILDLISYYTDRCSDQTGIIKTDIVKILVENFPNA